MDIGHVQFFTIKLIKNCMYLIIYRIKYYTRKSFGLKKLLKLLFGYIL